jgi:predicted transcriptional regulator
MSRDSELERRPAHLIVEAGEILRKVTPSRLATLLFVMDDEIETQTEMAEILGLSSSTITTDLQTLANLPLSLVQKRETQYSITDDGKQVIGYFDRAIGRIGKNLDLNNIDWKTDTEEIGTRLDPLHNSRSSMPFFVLESVSERTDLADTQKVSITDVVADVDHWQKERGKSVTRKRVRWMLGRFEEAGTIEIDDQITLIDKGQEHAKLLKQLIELLEDDQDDQTDANVDTSSESSPSTQQDATTGTAPTEQLTEIDNIGRDELQPERQRFSTGGQSIADSAKFLPIVPAYQLSQHSESESRSQSGELPVVPLPSTTTVAELVDQLIQIGREYGDDAELTLNWTLRTDASESGQNADINNWISNE